MSVKERLAPNGGCVRRGTVESWAGEGACRGLRAAVQSVLQCGDKFPLQKSLSPAQSKACGACSLS